MLSIIWGILKVIGLVVLIVFGFLLAVLLLVLFVPLRYKLTASGEYEKEAETSPEFFVKVRVSWLLRLVCVRLKADREGVKVQMKLFGIPLGRRKEKQQKEKKEKRRKQKTKNRREPEQEELLKTASVTEEETVTEIEETRESEETVTGTETVQVLEKTAAETEGDKGPEETAEEQKGKFQKVSGFFYKIKEFITGFFRNLRCTFEKICAKIKKIFGMAGEIRDFLKAEENKEAFRYVKEEAVKLFVHILPKKLSGQIVFGLEDPAVTGKILMVLGMIYPMIGKRLSITPLFENKLYVEGNLSFQGRIRLFSLLIIVIRVWFNKKFRGLLKRGRGLKEQLSRA